jgi:hypothetical protein
VPGKSAIVAQLRLPKTPATAIDDTPLSGGPMKSALIGTMLTLMFGGATWPKDAEIHIGAELALGEKLIAIECNP